MLSIGNSHRVFIANHRVDFRCGHDGLLAHAYRMGLDPLCKAIIILFIAKDLRKLKLLYSDDNGLWVSYKRFHRGKMKSIFRFVSDPSCTEISFSELSLLLSGSAYSISKRIADWPKKGLYPGFPNS